MKHLDLFSGIGGASLAMDWVWGNVEHTFVENDNFCQKVLRKHWPSAKIYGDIKEFKTEGIEADIITGGFPCQPFSQAGKRRGKEDDRDLWPEMARIIAEVKPRWVVGENVAGFVGMELDRTLFNLASEGYEAIPFIIPACAINAPHRRDRVWIIAHNDKIRELAQLSEIEPAETGKQALSRTNGGGSKIAPNADGKRRKGSGKKEVSRKQRISGGKDERGSTDFWDRPDLFTPKLCRNGNGVSERLDALGNAWVPQVAEKIFKAIKEVESL